nr:hypothetical protein [Candidatus Sigynarchaeota archaeon]
MASKEQVGKVAELKAMLQGECHVSRWLGGASKQQRGKNHG